MNMLMPPLFITVGGKNDFAEQVKVTERILREHAQMKAKLEFLANLDQRMFVMREEMMLCRVVKMEAEQGLEGVE
jgi:hypothetical protein